MKTNDPTEPEITEAQILAWLTARNKELQAVPGAPRDSGILLWEKNWGEGGLLVLVQAHPINTTACATFDEARAQFAARIETPEQKIQRIRAEAAKLLAQAEAIEAAHGEAR